MEKIKLLVVDDEVAILELLKEIFLQEGYGISTAENAAQALEHLEKESYNMIISDINMPGMKGYELLKIVGEKWPTMKKVLITSYNVEEYISIALKYDIGNIITKTMPFNITEITQFVSNLISGNIFGLKHYMLPGSEFNVLNITNPRKINDYSDFLSTLLVEDKQRRNRVKLVSVEFPGFRFMTNLSMYSLEI